MAIVRFIFALSLILEYHWGLGCETKKRNKAKFDKSDESGDREVVERPLWKSCSD